MTRIPIGLLENARPQKIRAGALFLKAKNSEDLYANKNTIGAFEWEKFC